MPNGEAQTCEFFGITFPNVEALKKYRAEHATEWKAHQLSKLSMEREVAEQLPETTPKERATKENLLACLDSNASDIVEQ